MTNQGFITAVELILKHEGGFVNHPADKGGPTNWGITQKVYEAFKGRPVTLNEMMNMSRNDAISIYKKQYWDKIGGDSLKYYSVALTLFDQAVNRGTGAVIKQAQAVLGLTQDGGMGPKTIAALNALPDTDFIPKFIMLAEQSYKNIVAKNPTQVVFLNGWMKRIESLKKQATNYYGQLNSAQKIGIGLGLFAILGIAGFLYYKGRK